MLVVRNIVCHPDSQESRTFSILNNILLFYIININYQSIINYIIIFNSEQYIKTHIQLSQVITTVCLPVCHTFVHAPILMQEEKKLVSYII